MSSTVFNIRFKREELMEIERSASEIGLSTAEYLRKSAALRPLTSILVKPQVSLSIGTPHFQYSTAATWNEAQIYQTTYHTIQ